jgi:glycosyltransferase involved in cell wall biosynthesis
MKILAVSSGCSVTGPSTGGNSAFISILKALHNLGNEIEALAHTSNAGFTENLLGVPEHLYGRGKGHVGSNGLADMSPALWLRLKPLIRDFSPDMIVVSGPGIVCSKALASLSGQKIRVVYLSENVEQSFLSQYRAESYVRPRALMMSAAQAVLERAAVSISDYVLCISQKDLLVFSEVYNVDRKKLFLAPSSRPVAQKLNENQRMVSRSAIGLRPDDFGIVFHGSYGHPPNRQAFELIRMKLAPILLKEEPSAKLFCFGTGTPKAKEYNFCSLGQVENVDEILGGMDLAIVPLLWGAGIKLKTLDYLANGLPVVSTKEGVAGFNLNPGEEYFEADSVEEFAEAIRILISSRQLRSALAEKGQDAFRKRLSDLQTKEALERFLEHLGDKRGVSHYEE